MERCTLRTTPPPSNTKKKQTMAPDSGPPAAFCFLVIIESPSPPSPSRLFAFQAVRAALRSADWPLTMPCSSWPPPVSSQDSSFHAHSCVLYLSLSPPLLAPAASLFALMKNGYHCCCFEPGFGQRLLPQQTTLAANKSKRECWPLTPPGLNMDITRSIQHSSSTGSLESWRKRFISDALLVVAHHDGPVSERV